MVHKPLITVELAAVKLRQAVHLIIMEDVAREVITLAHRKWNIFGTSMSSDVFDSL